MEIWNFRNEHVHQTDNIQNLQGKKVLEETILKEWNKGLNKLPILEFSHLFRLKKVDLMKKSIDGKKDWLLVVKTGRDLHNDKGETDEFDTNDALRFWIGLPRSNKR